MTAPLISVCIPVFNGEKYIRECIESVLCQSERNFELLICDNCSTDRTLDICNEFTDARIRILKSDRNIGSMDNFYRCIQNANGELFILLPCDDRLEENSLALMSRGFIENPSVGIVYGSHLQIDHQSKRIGEKLLDQKGVLVRKDAIRMIAKDFNPIQHPMVRMRALSQAKKFDKSFGCFCDIHMWLQIFFCGWDAYIVNTPLTSLRTHKNQGQSLFLQNTKGNLKRLSGHYGYPLPANFYRKNHFNLLFYRFVRYFNDNFTAELCENTNLQNVMISRLVRSHLSNIYTSFRQFNVSSGMMEMALSARLVRHYGPIRMLKSYFAVGGVFVRRLLQK